MGCDIHAYVEVRNGDVWKSADVWTEEDGWFSANPTVYNDRNYSLFAILAGVRNGVGFAGCKTGEGFNPISIPRGLPVDVSFEVKRCSDLWGSDGHSHSWLTIAELKAYNWDQETRRQGFVTPKEYKVFKANGRPDSWCGWCGGSSVEHLTESEMGRLVSGEAKEAPEKSCYTLVKWAEKYSESVGLFLTETIPRLETFGPPECVRLVFWFDN